MIPQNVAMLLMESFGAERNAEMWRGAGLFNRYQSDIRYSDSLRRKALQSLNEDGISQISPELNAKAAAAWDAYITLHWCTMRDGNEVAEGVAIIARFADRLASKGFPQLKYGREAKPWMFYATEELRLRARTEFLAAVKR